MNCWLAEHGVIEDGTPMPPCDGQLIRAHLIDKQWLRIIHRLDLADDPRTWRPACGGPMGNAGHHGMFDVSRRLRVPWLEVPAETVKLAKHLGLLGRLERRCSV